MDNNTTFDFDVIVIGGGPGGYVAAIRASQEGLKTALVESDLLGGICLNWGCIPVKSLLRSAEVYGLTRCAGEYGIIAEETGYNWSEIIARSRQISTHFSDGINHLMKKNYIKVIFGKGVIKDKGCVRVESDSHITITAKHIILATGAHPKSLPGIPFDHEKVITSSELIVLGKKPSSLVIAGAGAIGIELAYFFNTFGTKVTIVEIMDHILPGVDREIARRLMSFLRKSGINLITSAGIESVSTDAQGCSVKVSTGDLISCDRVLIAAGVSGNIDGIGLEHTGVVCERGFVKVDSTYRTSVDGIWAVGDCIGPPLLANTASMEAESAVESILGRESEHPETQQSPLCLQLKPNVASIGLTEQAVKEAGYDFIIGRCPFRIIGKAVTMGEPDGLTKVVIDKKSYEILGAHIIGAGAVEIIQEIVLAMNNGVTAKQLLKTVFPHPTLSEAIREAIADALGKPINM